MTESVPFRLAAFAVGTLAAFGAAFGVGRAVGPIGDDPPTHDTPAHEQPPPSDEGEAPSPTPAADPTTTSTHPAGHAGGDHEEGAS